MVVIDGSTPWIIWPLLFVGLMTISRNWGRGRRRRGRWDSDPAEMLSGHDADLLRREIEAQRGQLEEMATRIAELENRADFTERLLAAPHDKTAVDSAG